MQDVATPVVRDDATADDGAVLGITPYEKTSWDVENLGDFGRVRWLSDAGASDGFVVVSAATASREISHLVVDSLDDAAQRTGRGAFEREFHSLADGVKGAVAARRAKVCGCADRQNASRAVWDDLSI